MISFITITDEKVWFALSVLPPIAAAALLLRLMQGNPDHLKDTLEHLVTGANVKPCNGCLCLRFNSKDTLIGSIFDLVQGSADIMTQASTKLLTPRSPFTAFSASDCCSDPEPSELVHSGVRSRSRHGIGGESSRAPDKDAESAGDEREIWINLRHLTRASSVPVLFIMFYFWDSAAIHRRASYDFPLVHCMDPQSSTCFYINDAYHWWRYPHYNYMNCTGMRKATVKSKDGFFFQAPPAAKFYKCYTLIFTFSSMVGATGDAIALAAVFAVGILFASMHFHTMGLGTKQDVLDEQFRLRFKIVASLLTLVASAYTVPQLYGRKTNEMMIYLCVPGACVFFIILLANRHELLAERLKEDYSDSTVSDASSGEETSLNTWWDWARPLSPWPNQDLHIENGSHAVADGEVPRMGERAFRRGGEGPAQRHPLPAPAGTQLPRRGQFAGADQQVAVATQDPAPGLREPILAVSCWSAMEMANIAVASSRSGLPLGERGRPSPSGRSGAVSSSSGAWSP